jgi:hypothetical protein
MPADDSQDKCIDGATDSGIEWSGYNRRHPTHAPGGLQGHTCKFIVFSLSAFHRCQVSLHCQLASNVTDRLDFSPQPMDRFARQLDAVAVCLHQFN